MAHNLSVFVEVLFIFAIGAIGVTSQSCKKLTVVNNCNESVWPAIYRGGIFNGTIDELKKGQSAAFNVPSNWQGRVWGRTGCNFDTNGIGSCQTGGCGGSLECNNSGSPPASIAQFKLGYLDYYEVNLVEGFNLPVVITTIEGKANCSSAGCDTDLRESCPSWLALKPNGTIIACRGLNSSIGACNVFKRKSSCRPNNYSRAFKSACPAAAIYPQDETTSFLKCTSSEYVVSFCTPRNSTKCSYHNGKISCNGSSGLTTVSPGWWTLITLLPMLFTTHL